MSSTEPEQDPLATAYLPYNETKRRLDALTRGMERIGGGPAALDLSDEAALAMRAAIERVERGTR